MSEDRMLAKCDWCGGELRDIGHVETGMMLSAGWHVWLCVNPDCGHERELPKDGGEPR